MTVATIISKTDLARRTRQIVNQARRGGAVIVESYGEEQVAILDAADYRCLRAVAALLCLAAAAITGHGQHALRRAASTRMRYSRPSSRPMGTHRPPGIVC